MQKMENVYIEALYKTICMQVGRYHDRDGRLSMLVKTSHPAEEGHSANECAKSPSAVPDGDNTCYTSSPLSSSW